MTNSPPPLGTITQRNDGMFIGTYLNRKALSLVENRVLAYLETIKLEEAGLDTSTAMERAQGQYPYPEGTKIQVVWGTVQPAQRLVAGFEPESSEAVKAREEVTKQAKPELERDK